MTEVTHKAFGAIILAFILMNFITSPDQLPKVDTWDLQCLSGAMEIENGSNGDRALLLTGSVILNRLNSPKWDGNTIEEVVLARDYGYQQYASVTRNGFRNKKASERTVLLAKYLLLYGAICPPTVMYQGTAKNGHGVYEALSNLPGQRATEYFCYE